MSERVTHLLVADIQISISNVLEFTREMTLEMYECNLKTRFALERNFEIIGEAASRISENYRLVHPEIEWRILKDFRNFIIHEYFGIDNRIKRLSREVIKKRGIAQSLLGFSSSNYFLNYLKLHW